LKEVAIFKSNTACLPHGSSPDCNEEDHQTPHWSIWVEKSPRNTQRSFASLPPILLLAAMADQQGEEKQ
jgi:hypothetical protein